LRALSGKAFRDFIFEMRLELGMWLRGKILDLILDKVCEGDRLRLLISG
jgi:hypothetical protein